MRQEENDYTDRDIPECVLKEIEYTPLKSIGLKVHYWLTTLVVISITLWNILP